ncbi:hypothetical protein Poli38472_001008 [Pythium oligandrum]|uniref:EGF-like domain-containing protein n=1 Tax=Pythium oligandrum TaxID=41045 RepID=A0A8K1CCS0_PYTOL|nr:hypothetical protein Poli38472_001008 [Pythium oligandrum]|eukprot:TMW60966.1 hypothetical protein Poli38472_001008 [Pythium oligandrum]
MRTTTALTAALAVHASTALAATSSITFKTVKGQIYADDQPFYIKGVNWFGFETIESVVQGLWPSATTIEAALDLLQSYDVNALRLPLALDSIISNPEVDNDQTAGTPALAGKTYLEVLDYFIYECRKRNILVVLDNHRMEASEPDFPDVAEPKKIIPALEKLAERYCSNPATWNVLGIDIKNEPKGKATWGSGDESTDWNLAAATIGNAVLDKCKRFLIFVEGVQTNIKGETVEWGQAGGSLQGTKKNPVKLKNMERLVYSPHLISPGVDYKSPWWLASDFPSNMVKIWDSYFGFVPEKTGNPVVIGAWGAKMEGKNEKWATEVASYLAKNKLGSFYWAFNPQSADTGGLVKDDWRTAIEERFELLADLPTTDVSKLLNKYGKCKDGCKGYGQCVDGQCECYAGWTGPQCDVCTPGDTTACNNGGTCQDDSTCLCDADTNGKYCAGESCDNISCGNPDYAGCVNGACVCTYECIGSDCTPCATNSSALAAAKNNETILCGSCPVPVQDTKDAGNSVFAASTVALSIMAVALFVLVF